MEFILLHLTVLAELTRGAEKTEDHSSVHQTPQGPRGGPAESPLLSSQEPHTQPGNRLAHTRRGRRGPVCDLRPLGYSLEVDKLWSFTETSQVPFAVSPSYLLAARRTLIPPCKRHPLRQAQLQPPPPQLHETLPSGLVNNPGRELA